MTGETLWRDWGGVTHGETGSEMGVCRAFEERSQYGDLRGKCTVQIMVERLYSKDYGRISALYR